MAESAFNFNQAPNHKGRQFAALSSIGKLFSNKNDKSGGISARDKSALMHQQSVHDINHTVIKHTVGEIAADAAHTRSQSAADAAHQRQIGATTNLIDHFERLGSSKQYSNLNVGVNGVSGTYVKPDSPSSTNAPSSGSVNLDN
jgi:hypothetical protein